MPSAPAQASKKTILYLLGVVVLLLIAVIAVVVVRGQGATTATDNTAAGSSVAATATSMPGVGASTGAAFDPKTATRVPAGTTPETFVKTYYQAILDKKWDVAFKMQPATSQQGGTVEGFQQTQTGYGMTAFKVIEYKAEDASATVEVEQDLGQNGTWGVLWTFVKDGSDWVVKSRAVSMK